MSTRSEIGIYNHEENTLTFAYCHFDGYYAGAGRILVDHVTTTEKAQELISGGDFSFLERNGTVGRHYEEDGKPSTKTFENWNDLVTFINNRLETSDREYIYVWHTEENKWYSAHVEVTEIKANPSVCARHQYIRTLEWFEGEGLLQAIETQEQYFAELEEIYAWQKKRA